MTEEKMRAFFEGAKYMMDPDDFFARATVADFRRLGEATAASTVARIAEAHAAGRAEVLAQVAPLVDALQTFPARDPHRPENQAVQALRALVAGQQPEPKAEKWLRVADVKAILMRESSQLDYAKDLDDIARLCGLEVCP